MFSSLITLEGNIWLFLLLTALLLSAARCSAGRRWAPAAAFAEISPVGPAEKRSARPAWLIGC